MLLYLLGQLDFGYRFIHFKTVFMRSIQIKFTFMICMLTCMLVGAISIKAQNSPAYEDDKFSSWISNRKTPNVSVKFTNIPASYAKGLDVKYTVVTFSGQGSTAFFLQKPEDFQLKLNNPYPYQQIFLSIDSLLYTCVYAFSDLIIEIDLKQIIESGEELEFYGKGIAYLQSDGRLNSFMNQFLVTEKEKRLSLDDQLRKIPHFTEKTKAASSLQIQAIFDSLKLVQTNFIRKTSNEFAWLLENERMSDYFAEMLSHSLAIPPDDALLKEIKNHKTYALTNNSSLLYRYLFMGLQRLPANTIKTTWKELDVTHMNVDEKGVYDSLALYADTPSSDSIVASKKLQWSKKLQPYFIAINNNKRWQKNIHIIDSLFSDTRADLLKMQLNDNKDVEAQTQTLKKLIPVIKTPWLNHHITSLYTSVSYKATQIDAIIRQSTQQKTSDSFFTKPILQTYFGATLYKVSNTDATSFLRKLKDFFTGKSIFIDLWATWCTPCISEMPHSKKLEEESKNLPLVFVYLCTDNTSSEEIWKRKIVELKQPGVHFFIDDTLATEIMNLFSQTGYPSYILLNKNGTVKSGFNLRPSNMRGTKGLLSLIQ